jgi:hypothetical protein
MTGLLIERADGKLRGHGSVTSGTEYIEMAYIVLASEEILQQTLS